VTLRFFKSTAGQGVFLVGYTVAMVLRHENTIMESKNYAIIVKTMIGQFFDSMIVASTDNDDFNDQSIKISPVNIVSHENSLYVSRLLRYGRDMFCYQRSGDNYTLKRRHFVLEMAKRKHVNNFV